jgi:hypothetical protein
MGEDAPQHTLGPSFHRVHQDWNRNPIGDMLLMEAPINLVRIIATHAYIPLAL